MGDPANGLLPPASSPTNSISSVDSSDLDTESTGSFFHDRSTTLGTLMGVNFPAVTFRAPPSQSQHRDLHVHVTATTGTTRPNKKRNKKRTSPIMSAPTTARRRWWQICGDDDDAKPASLGEFLEVERRFGDTAAFYNAAAELEGVMVSHQQQQPRNGRLLFADGRVLPPVRNLFATGSLTQELRIQLQN